MKDRLLTSIEIMRLRCAARLGVLLRDLPRPEHARAIDAYCSVDGDSHIDSEYEPWTRVLEQYPLPSAALREMLAAERDLHPGG